MSKNESDNSHISVFSNPQQEVIAQLQGQLIRLEKKYAEIEKRLKIWKEFVTVTQFVFQLKSDAYKYYSFDIRILYKARTWEYVAFCEQFPSLVYYGKSTAKVGNYMKNELRKVVNDLENTGYVVPQ